MPLQGSDTPVVLCYWCGRATDLWPYSGEHKHKWRWCSRCEAARDQDGQGFPDDV